MSIAPTPRPSGPPSKPNAEPGSRLARRVAAGAWAISPPLPKNEPDPGDVAHAARQAQRAAELAQLAAWTTAGRVERIPAGTTSRPAHVTNPEIVSAA
jgi:hypothetical protein